MAYPGAELKPKKKVRLLTIEEEDEEMRKTLRPLIASKISGYLDVYLPLEVEENIMFNCTDCLRELIASPHSYENAASLAFIKSLKKMKCPFHWDEPCEHPHREWFETRRNDIRLDYELSPDFK